MINNLDNIRNFIYSVVKDTVDWQENKLRFVIDSLVLSVDNPECKYYFQSDTRNSNRNLHILKNIGSYYSSSISTLHFTEKYSNSVTGL